MIWLETQCPEFFNDICDEIRLFYGMVEISKLDDENILRNGEVLRHFFSDGEVWVSTTEFWQDGIRILHSEESIKSPNAKNELEYKKFKKRLCKQNIYKLLKKDTGKVLPWGSLTGIRPTKLARESIEEIGGVKAMRLFRDEFDVSEEKTKLAFDIVGNQLPFLQVPQNAIDIYIGIPFCVSRCKYCSFVSQDINRTGKFKKEYLDKLKYEINSTKNILSEHRVRSIYIGGGTPTSLDADEIDSLLGTVADVFGTPYEFTVEAGRPDTITSEKLRVLKNRGVGRISINPQTTNQSTLNIIGRNHSVEQFFSAFELAREFDFSAINADIILGLPDEGVADVERTIKEISNLSPENITIHTLALKRSSAFVVEQEGKFHSSEEMSEMVELAHGMLGSGGYLPYYLYRQKYMSGNLENTGYSKPNKICVYNIDHMEETTSIMAFGAGAISKRIFDAEQRIERAANVKDIEHYINRTNEMIERKHRLFTF